MSFQNRHALVSQAALFVPMRSFAVVWAGFVIAVPFSQMVGHGPFLELMMGDGYVRTYKRVIEESGEFVGYIVLLMGGIECLLQLRAAWCFPTPDHEAGPESSPSRSAAEEVGDRHRAG